MTATPITRAEFENDLKSVLQRLTSHKMSPQETFEQRVSFVSEGRNKDEVRRMMIETNGYPAEATERPQIVSFLRDMVVSDTKSAEMAGDDEDRATWLNAAAALEIAADAIERGDHLK